MTQRLHSKILWILWHIGKVLFGSMMGKKRFFREKAKRGRIRQRSSIVSYTHVYIYIFFFSNITKLVTATRKQAEKNSKKKKKGKKYQHDISSTMNHRCTQVVKPVVTRFRSIDETPNALSINENGSLIGSHLFSGATVSPGLTAGFKSGNHFYAVKRGEIGAAAVISNCDRLIIKYPLMQRMGVYGPYALPGVEFY